ncbi:alcohol oxidase [Gyrodon lividus]|nr:alcohol oxidase [Gyrodon lividus]
MDGSSPLASDFIIVGGGTAGLVLARRLSEAGHSVHVLEAGRKIKSLGAEDPVIPFDTSGKLDLKAAVSMPALAVTVLKSGEIDWRDFSAAEYGNGKIFMPAGKVLGGSSTLNLALWTRGDATDYDLIADINNDPSWKFESLKKHFKRSETFHPDPSKPFDRENYGNDGPIHVVPVDTSKRGYAMSEYARGAYEAAGFKYNGYGNDGNSLGFNELGQTTYPMDGGRQSSMKYIKPFDTDNLRVSELQTVASIMFEEKKVIGVKTVEGVTYKARKEVLLCAGALRSPAILQHSGIGDESHLKKHGIPVVHHLPGVGQNLWDHPVVFLKWRLHDKHAKGTLDELRSNPKKMVEELTKYNQKQGGLFEGPPFDFSAWKNYAPACQKAIVLDDKNGDETTLSRPIRNYITSNRTPHAQFLMAYVYPFPPDNLTGSYITLLTIVSTPTSRGHVKIISNDPSASPECDPKWLSTEVDRTIMKEAMKTSNEVILKMVDEEGIPVVAGEADAGGDPLALGFDEEGLARKLGTCVTTIYHYAGTCAMAPLGSTGPLPVVDTDCRVHGVQGLRIVDASVFPVPISANTQAPVYALAEKIAEAILTEYSLIPSQSNVIRE